MHRSRSEGGRGALLLSSLPSKLITGAISIVLLAHRLVFAILLFQIVAGILPAALAQNIEPTNQTAMDSGSATIDLEMIRQRLHGEGVKGEIHAADPANRQFVFTYRDPKNFFVNEQFVMASKDPAVQETFSKMHRHDLVLIKGEFFHEGDGAEASPQMHIKVKSIEILKPFEPAQAAPEKFQKTTKLPNDLLDKTEADFLVHAVPKGGDVLVLEYRDNFVFVAVPDKRFTEKLYRNDRIHLRFHVEKHPKSPTHLELDTDTSKDKKPIEVLDSVVAMHGQKKTQEGALVLFPQSPQIVRDVWAIEQKGPDGNSRTFTLVNFDKPDEQKKIDAKLRQWWDAKDNKFVDGRNKLLSVSVKIRATGIMNVVNPNQANAQMKLNAADIVRISN